LGRRGALAPDLERLGRLLDRCDAARFGAASEGPGERKAALDEALALLRRSSLTAREGA
jgi:hypothetical protein